MVTLNVNVLQNPVVVVFFFVIIVGEKSKLNIKSWHTFTQE